MVNKNRHVMKKEYEENDIIGRLMSEEGLLSTSPGFTERVMQMIEVSSQNAGTAYKPLISRNAWLLIALIVAAILLASIGVAYSGDGGQLSYLSKITAVTGSLLVPHISLDLDNNAFLLVTVMLAVVSLLLLFDLFLNRILQETAK